MGASCVVVQFCKEDRSCCGGRSVYESFISNYVGNSSELGCVAMAAGTKCFFTHKSTVRGGLLVRKYFSWKVDRSLVLMG